MGKHRRKPQPPQLKATILSNQARQRLGEILAALGGKNQEPEAEAPSALAT